VILRERGNARRVVVDTACAIAAGETFDLPARSLLLLRR
jgi:hypothetical protein